MPQQAHPTPAGHATCVTFTQPLWVCCAGGSGDKASCPEFVALNNECILNAGPTEDMQKRFAAPKTLVTSDSCCSPRSESSIPHPPPHPGQASVVGVWG